MDNTVGSYWKNKNLQKKWIPFKKNLTLTPTQRSVLIGSLLGDGTLRQGKNAINANFKVEHGLKQKDYVIWKYQIFQNWVLTEPKLSFRYHIDRTKYQKSWWFRTVRHPILTQYKEKFYLGNKKVIPDLINNYLDSLAFAVWIMDDGCYQHGIIDISTYSFTLKEIHKLQAALEEKFGLISKYFRDRDKGYRLYFSSSQTKKVICIIETYVIPSMRYKLGSSN